MMKKKRKKRDGGTKSGSKKKEERGKKRERKKGYLQISSGQFQKRKNRILSSAISLSLSFFLSRSHSLVFDRWKNRKERGELSAILNFHPRHVLLDMYRHSIRETRLCLQCPLEIGGGRGGQIKVERGGSPMQAH